MTIPVNRSLPVKCPSCGKVSSVPLFLRADEQPVDCPECGANICTMGELMDRVVQRTYDVMLKGLKRRAGL